MAVTAVQIRRGLWRAVKWLLAILVFLYVGWLVGLVPKPYISAASYVVPAYFSDPDPECRAQPTPECLADMAEQSVYDIYDHFGGYPIEAQYVGMLHVSLGDFERADRLAALYATWEAEEFPDWEPYEDEREGPVTPYYDQKVAYLLGVGKWRETLTMVAEFHQKGMPALSNCDQMRNIALGLAVNGTESEATEVLDYMAAFGCDEDIEGSEHTYNTLSEARRSVDLLLLLHLPRDELAHHADYQNALWEWLSGRSSWKVPPAFADYCDLLTSIDPDLLLHEGQLRGLLTDLLNAEAMIRTKEVFAGMRANPVEMEMLLDWLQDRFGYGVFRKGANIRFIADTYLSEDEHKSIALRVAEKAAWNLDRETIEWTKPYLNEAEYEDAMSEYGRELRGHRAMLHRMIRISEDYRHDRAGSIDELKALSDEYIWRWYHLPLASFGLDGSRNLDSHTTIVSMLFEYGAYDDGFELIKKLAYHPGALTSAAWGLSAQENPRPDRSCPSY